MGKIELDYLAMQSYYDEGHSLRETAEKFGTSPQALDSARRRGLFITRKRSDAVRIKAEQKRKED